MTCSALQCRHIVFVVFEPRGTRFARRCWPVHIWTIDRRLGPPCRVEATRPMLRKRQKPIATTDAKQRLHEAHVCATPLPRPDFRGPLAVEIAHRCIALTIP